MPWNFPKYPENWSEIAKMVRLRDNGRCVSCGANDLSLHVDHIVSLSKGGSNELSNLQTLCEECHRKKHPWLRTSEQVSVPDYRYCKKCMKAYLVEITFRTSFCPDCNMYLIRTPPKGNIDYSPCEQLPDVMRQPALIIEDWYWTINNNLTTKAKNEDVVVACINLSSSVRFLGIVSVSIRCDNIGPDSEVDKKEIKISEEVDKIVSVKIKVAAEKKFYRRGYFIAITRGSSKIEMPPIYPPRLKIINK